MPNAVTVNGLQTATRDELIADFTAAMEGIYGPDINLDQDSPDGQMMNIFIQAILDNLDLITQVYNMFDPDNAIGVVLDQRVAINGIQRQAGTYTLTNITIVTSQALNLYGLDQTVQPQYTVADNAGNKWVLVNTQSCPAPGTYAFEFRAELPGARFTIPNTITVPVTVVLGVSSINNPTTYTTLGIDEESDAALKIRRQKSVSLASQGYLAGLIAALENINGINVFVYENNTSTTNIDGVPGHSIWVIVSGTADPELIARAIYNKRNAGCGLFGSTSYTLTQVDGTPFTVFWDVVVPETLYIKFTATSIDGVNPPNVGVIREQLVTLFVPGVNEEIDINHLATKVQEIDPNTLVTNAGFSLAPTGPFTNTLQPSAKNKQFAVTEPNIIIIPILMIPSDTIVVASGTRQFEAQGGFGAYTWSMDANPSGGSVDPSGLYTAGATDGVTDVIRVTDAQGNFTTSNITVVP